MYSSQRRATNEALWAQVYGAWGPKEGHEYAVRMAETAIQQFEERWSEYEQPQVYVTGHDTGCNIDYSLANLREKLSQIKPEPRIDETCDHKLAMLVAKAPHRLPQFKRKVPTGKTRMYHPHEMVIPVRQAEYHCETEDGMTGNLWFDEE